MNSFIHGTPLDKPQSTKSTVKPRSRPRWGLFGFLIILGLQAFLIYQVLGNKDQISDSQKHVKLLNERMIASVNNHEKNLSSLNADFSVVQKRLGVTQNELNRARTIAQQIREEQQRSVEQLNAEISLKADSQQLSALQNQADSKFGAVNADVTAVKTDVTAVKTDVEATKKALEGTRRDIVDVRATLTQQIARNKGELDQLRLKGERNFYEFDIRKKGWRDKGFTLVGDIRIGVRKTNRKRQRYTVRIVVDDSTLEKKNRNINEPVQFLVGPTKLRYELVVNEVRKNRIIGYLSVPKDKGLSAERTS